MKIALIHDDLIQWGGAEKVLAEISNIFPEAPIYTAIADFKNPFIKKNFQNKKIITSFLQQLPFLKTLYKPLMPLYPIAFEQFDFTDFDLVISQTTRFAKSVITKPETTHICYIHTPPRFLWNYSNQKTNKFLKPLINYLKNFDYISSKRVDYWIAGSENCQTRLSNTYGVESKVLYPFVDTEKLNPQTAFNGGYYLLISRLNKYKNVNTAVKAFNLNGKNLTIVGSGPELNNLRSNASSNIKFLSRVSDPLLENLIAGCKGLIITAEEDFGMTSIEAQSFGKGVIAYGAGGALETIIPGKTGNFFPEQSTDSLNKAIDIFESLKISPADCFQNAQKFSREKFKQRLLDLVAGFSSKL